MPNVTEHHHSGKAWHSPPSYFGAGYKMCLVVTIIALNLDNSSSVYVSIQFLNGERDDQLNWPTTVHGGRCGPPPDHHILDVYLELSYVRIEAAQNCNGETILSSTNLVNDCHVFNVTWYTNCILEVELQS